MGCNVTSIILRTYFQFYIKMRRVLAIVLFVLLISFLMESYAYQGIKLLTEDLSADLKIFLRIFYWILFFGTTFLLGIRMLFVGIPPGKSKLTEYLFSMVISLFITNLVFITVLFAEDVYRLFYGLIQALIYKNSESFFPHRNIFISRLALGLSLFTFFSFLYGMIRGKHSYKVHKHSLFFEDLPAAFDGFKIVQISDIHSGSFNHAKSVQKGINLVNAQQADLFVFTGDLVNNLASEIEPWLNHFNQIKAPYGQFSILGNHDYGDYIRWPSKEHKHQNLEQLKLHHQNLGFKLLLDEHVKIEKDGEKIILIGVENWGKGFGERGDLDKALHQTDADGFKILLSHDPSHFDEIIKTHDTQIHLTLSGHTHGMQMGIETPFFKWSPVKLRYKNWAGLFIENGRHLYVNRGFGFIGFSGRVGIWPEITLIELKRKKG